MDEEVDAMERASDFAVGEHAFGAVAEGEYRYACRADGSLGGQIVHGGVGDTFGGYVALHP